LVNEIIYIKLLLKEKGGEYLHIFVSESKKENRKWTKKMSKIEKGGLTFAKNVPPYHKSFLSSGH